MTPSSQRLVIVTQCGRRRSLQVSLLYRRVTHQYRSIFSWRESIYRSISVWYFPSLPSEPKGKWIKVIASNITNNNGNEPYCFLSLISCHSFPNNGKLRGGKVKANLHDSEILCDDISVNGPIKTGIATLRSSTCGSVGYTVAENIQQSLIGKSITRWPRR